MIETGVVFSSLTNASAVVTGTEDGLARFTGSLSKADKDENV